MILKQYSKGTDYLRITMFVGLFFNVVYYFIVVAYTRGEVYMGAA